jgi:hypothetical protein
MFSVSITYKGIPKFLDLNSLEDRRLITYLVVMNKEVNPPMAGRFFVTSTAGMQNCTPSPRLRN